MKRLYLSETDKKLTGLCGGIGEFLEVDPTLIRLATVFVCLVTGIVPVVVAYIVGWLIVPKKDDRDYSSDTSVQNPQ